MPGYRKIYMVPLDTVSTVYHSIFIHEKPRKDNDSKNIKSLHFDPGKLEPLKKTLILISNRA